ncbi:hypothetical protein FA95DRAFT_1612983 [Auriscalpium vulgare]|uniref:Uncharacterized protein n=1 Tax=Auriscalpium vulgare TaxID=40419 RepID=A0ACB8R4M2_9AGAM|nr:hypothetical protein FA95DRAFT_1612983 [Auriscalpium vulgare]
MVLQQAAAEGYSGFSITQTDPSAPLTLTRTNADHLHQPASTGLEDEDLELQAALQASLGGEPAP